MGFQFVSPTDLKDDVGIHGLGSLKPNNGHGLGFRSVDRLEAFISPDSQIRVPCDSLPIYVDFRKGRSTQLGILLLGFHDLVLDRFNHAYLHSSGHLSQVGLSVAMKVNVVVATAVLLQISTLR